MSIINSFQGELDSWNEMELRYQMFSTYLDLVEIAPHIINWSRSGEPFETFSRLADLVSESIRHPDFIDLTHAWNQFDLDQDGQANYDGQAFGMMLRIGLREWLKRVPTNEQYSSWLEQFGEGHTNIPTYEEVADRAQKFVPDINSKLEQIIIEGHGDERVHKRLAEISLGISEDDGLAAIRDGLFTSEMSDDYVISVPLRQVFDSRIVRNINQLYRRDNLDPITQIFLPGDEEEIETRSKIFGLYLDLANNWANRPEFSNAYLKLADELGSAVQNAKYIDLAHLWDPSDASNASHGIRTEDMEDRVVLGGRHGNSNRGLMNYIEKRQRSDISMYEAREWYKKTEQTGRILHDRFSEGFMQMFNEALRQRILQDHGDKPTSTILVAWTLGIQPFDALHEGVLLQYGRDETFPMSIELLGNTVMLPLKDILNPENTAYLKSVADGYLTQLSQRTISLSNP